MSISRFVPPMEYLRAASRSSLQSFELARLNHAANLRREIAALIDQWIQETSEATLARWMLDHHKSFPDSPPTTDPGENLPLDCGTDLLPDSSVARADIVPAPPRFTHDRTIRSPQTRKLPKSSSAAVG